MPETSPSSKNDYSSLKPEATREELISLLTHASDLEHSLACVCLFAAYSLKNDVSEGGLTGAQADMVRGWRRRLASAAVDRMCHLAQISNLLTAIGAAPVIVRPTLLRSTSAASPEGRLTLEPFSQQLLDRLVTYEHLSAPLGEDGLDTYGSGEAQNLTIGDLYDRITVGFGSMPAEELFIGPKEAQADPHLLDLGDQLVAVVDLESARAALATLIETDKGESGGAAAGIFSATRTEYVSALEDARQTNQPFEPVRSVVANPGARLHGEIGSGTRIADALTVAVANLFNGAYDTLILLLRRFFTHTEETNTDLERLARASLR